jgi:hypothetical protein
VPDRLYLSCWVRGFTGANMLRHFEKLLDVFPFSKLEKRGSELRVYALEHAEPPLIDRAFPPGNEPSIMVAAAREFMHDDCACELSAAWDLWQFEGDWKVAPAGVVLSCFGPAFDHDVGDHLRIEFGLDSRFIPDPTLEGSPRLVESNLRSLLHLVHEIERVLGLARRQLWSESGANPAELIADVLRPQ